MKNNRGNVITLLLVIVLIIQIYIIFFNNPVSFVNKGLVESSILLQGRDPGVPEPVPGKEPELDNKVTVQNIGPEARPVIPGVSHGEGQPVPKAPRAALPKAPKVPGVPDDIDLQLSLEGSEDFYRIMVYGVIILQQEKDLQLSKEQAERLKKVFEMKKKVDDAVPETQKIIMETLTDEQLKYIYIQKCIQEGGSVPLPPEYVENSAPKVMKILEKKL